MIIARLATASSQPPSYNNVVASFINSYFVNDTDTHKTGRFVNNNYTPTAMTNSKNIFDIQHSRGKYHCYWSTQVVHGLTCEFLLDLNVLLYICTLVWNTFKSIRLMQHPTTIWRPMLKAFFVRATKHWSIIGLVRQSWYKNHCWGSTTVSDRMERWHNRTAPIKLILYS